MDHPLRRLLVIAFLVSITFSSSAQNETPSEEDDEERTLCIPGTTHCNSPHPGNRKLNKEAIADSPVEASGEEDASKSEPSIICDPITKLCEGPKTRIRCIPGTPNCNIQLPPDSGISKLNEEAVAEEDTSKFETRTICNPITKLCQGPNPAKFDISDSPVVASGDEDASKSEPSKICDPITEICEGPDSRTVCDPITHICREPNLNSFVSESAKVKQTEDDSVIHEEKEKISPLVCDPHTGKCQDPHQNFGVAKPRDESA